MKTLQQLSEPLRHPGVLLLWAFVCSVVLAACSVTEPSEAKDVSAYSWPTESNVSMLYKRETRNQSLGRIDTEQITYITQNSRAEYHGRTMYELFDTSSSSTTRTLFLPLKDTLVVEQDPLACKYALVAPLEKGHEWTSPNSSDPDSIRTWKATIIERYDYKRVEGKIYHDVVEVQYTPIDPKKTEIWIRVYGDGIGVLQTIRYSYPEASNGGSSGQNLRQEEQRTVLVRSDAAQD